VLASKIESEIDELECYENRGFNHACGPNFIQASFNNQIRSIFALKFLVFRCGFEL
jgi:hypothetical protein